MSLSLLTIFQWPLCLKQLVYVGSADCSVFIMIILLPLSFMVFLTEEIE
uniref:Uncharacterized protein n=1 Tax=Anguilla anguilla TaxID=7936 RepID=A0A0E9SV03_ANGAN